jgi:hypothetical protein
MAALNMNLIYKLSILCGIAAAALWAQGPGVIESKQAKKDVAPDPDPHLAFWQGIPPVIAESDTFGKLVPGHRTEIRSRWTGKNLYLLFICPYQELNLKPDPKTDVETNNLWNWDVAEAFIGSDPRHIRLYKEFEVSPQGEWVDLDIDLNSPHHEDGWKWNSGLKVAVNIDHKSKTWYACMRIPYSSIDTRPPAAGNILRVNFFRAQGPPPERKGIAWQPTRQHTYHVPEAFGRLKLVY